VRLRPATAADVPRPWPAIPKRMGARPRGHAKGQPVPAIAFAIPIPPGQEALDRNTLDEMAGARRDDYKAALRDAGVSRHTVWHQETHDGTIAVVDTEAHDEAGGREVRIV
jgi:hypothetical protein